MQIEPLGIVVLVLGLAGWFAGPAFSTYIFMASTTLGAAGAIILTSFGSATIQPAHLLLGFLALPSAMRRSSLRLVAQALAFPKTGFWLLLTAVYATISAMFLPRLFAGLTYVFAIARLGVAAIPLAPTSGNVTQTIYLLGDVVCFLVFYSYACKPERFQVIVKAVLAVAALNITFAVLDLVTYWTHTQYLLSFIRNASYRMLNEASIQDYKRIVGSFAEASAFAYFTLAPFAFCTRLWLANVHARLTGPLALLSFAALIFSTSSSGYAGLCGFLAALFVTSAARILTRPVSRATFGFVMLAPLLLATFLVGARLHPPAWMEIQRMIDATIVNKLSTDSGRERTRWNEQALANFVDTQGLGAGLGSVRASSLPIAVLANIGVIGAVTYGSFLFGLFFGRRHRWTEPYPATCQSAARWACFVQLIGASVAASFPEVDLPFFVFAGLACAGPGVHRLPQVVPMPRPVAAGVS